MLVLCGEITQASLRSGRNGEVSLSSTFPRAGTTDANAAFRASVDMNGFRRRRVARLVDHLRATCGGKDVIRILDVGGVRGFWEGARALWQGLPLDITIVNIGAQPVDDGPFHIRPGDACALDWPDASFDLVHSNSVIEHVGSWRDMERMAREVSRVAPHLFVQTPDFWFPLEPHYRTPFFHWYPPAIRARLLMRRKRGFRAKADTLAAAMRDVETVSLLTERQMQALFPDARIEHERVLGLSKSLIAVR